MTLQKKHIMKYLNKYLTIEKKNNDLYYNVYLCNTGIVLKGLRLIKASVFENVSINYFYKYALYKKFFEKKTYIKTKNNIIIHNHWSSGYHHWLTESLRRLLYIKTEQYNLIIPSDYPEFAFESLKAFKFNSIIKLPKKTGARLDELIIPPNKKSGHYKKQQLLDLRIHLFSYFKIQIKKTKKNVYITRRKANKRKVENEVELIDLLKTKNFLIIEAENLTFREQIELFSSCKILIGIHGAGLTNCLFMQKNTYMLEFYKKDTFINYCFERMARELEINYRRQFCEGGKNKETHVDITDLIVDIDLVKKYLNSII